MAYEILVTTHGRAVAPRRVATEGARAPPRHTLAFSSSAVAARAASAAAYGLRHKALDPKTVVTVVAQDSPPHTLAVSSTRALSSVVVVQRMVVETVL